jgi:acyl dehydratase
LDNAGAHEGVGRDRIAAVATAVDREHTKASSREEQRGGCAGATGSDNDDVEIDRWGSDGDNISTTSDVASRVQLGYMSSNINQIWPGGIPCVGQVAERSRTVNAKDIELFTKISGDRNPLHYDEAVAKASRFGEIVVQGGVTSAILNAVVAEDLPGPGTVFLQVNWSFKAPVRPGDTITGRAEVLEVRTDKPITKLKTSVIRDDGTLVLDGDAVCYTMPIAKGVNA